MTEILVLGAGMVGTTTALAFQERGHDVTLVDRRTPGRETSFGNAGIIQIEAAEPYALPLAIGKLFAMAAGHTNDVTWSLRGAGQMAPALFSYLVNSTPRRLARISDIYSRLTVRATQDHAPLIDAAGAQNLIAKEGLSVIYRDQAQFDAAVVDARRIESRFGRAYRALDGESYRKEDPSLIKTPAGVIHWTESWSCASPGELVAAYAGLFARRGGRIVTGDAASLAQTATGWQVDTEDGTLSAPDAVIALGPWAPKLLAPLGYRVPMVYKRGYHGHYETPIAPKRPFLDASNGVVASGMVDGLRVATGAALVTMDSPPDLRQLERGVKGLSDLVAIGPRRSEPQWTGTRPCMPNMLPVLGPAPRHKGLWVHFGHGHQGFTLGPTTAGLLVDLYDGKRSDLSDALTAASHLR